MYLYAVNILSNYIENNANIEKYIAHILLPFYYFYSIL